MSVFRVDVNPTFRDLDGRFSKASAQLLDDRRDQVRSLARRFVQLAQQEAPKKTGQFAQGIAFRTYQGTDNLRFTVSDPQPLGKWIRQGTRAHEIKPRGPGYPLRFFWPKVGAVVYRYRVWHPGTKPNLYHERAQAQWQPEADADLRRISTRYVQTIAKGR